MNTTAFPTTNDSLRLNNSRVMQSYFWSQSYKVRPTFEQLVNVVLVVVDPVQVIEIALEEKTERFKYVLRGPRGNGVMDKAVACHAGGPGSIPAASKWFLENTLGHKVVGKKPDTI